jgi:hypothetical protein
MFNNQDKLDIFENFIEDRSLPKFLEETPNFGVVLMSWDQVSQVQPNKTGFWQWLLSFFGLTRSTISMQEFFVHIKNSLEEIEVIQGIAEQYEEQIRRAIHTRQKALQEKLMSELLMHRHQAQLVALGMSYYLSEATLVKFVKLSPRGLRLDWISNFIRVIPEHVLAKKQRCDDLEIFDNYVVLHYDPEKKSWSETQKEIEARKDPILFGLISGSRRLYPIGDWIDEYCDLSLEQVLALIAKDKSVDP